MIGHCVAEQFFFDGFGGLDDFVFVHGHFGVAFAEAFFYVKKILQAVRHIELPDMVRVRGQQTLMRRRFEQVFRGYLFLPQPGQEAAGGNAARLNPGIIEDHLGIAGGEGNLIGCAPGGQHERRGIQENSSRCA